LYLLAWIYETFLSLFTSQIFFFLTFFQHIEEEKNNHAPPNYSTFSKNDLSQAAPLSLECFKLTKIKNQKNCVEFDHANLRTT
jgi:hypothetical protein